MSDALNIAIAQTSPVWLDKQLTIEKAVRFIQEAGVNGSELICFGEAFIPGYPFWIEHTEGAKFDSKVQKDLHSHYMSQAVNIESGDLDPLVQACNSTRQACVIGIIECPEDRGGHSLYCSLVYIDEAGIQSVHRKLMPTYEERLSWSPGDGAGLKTHKLKNFTVGGLNCWENWMPLARTALYGQGEDLHVAIWPGNLANTADITRFIAREGRSYSIAASSLLKKQDISTSFPHKELVAEALPEIPANGGSCVAGPNGEWIIEPDSETDGLIYCTLDHSSVRGERQNFDAVGHYSRPDVLKLSINPQRQSSVSIETD